MRLRRLTAAAALLFVGILAACSSQGTSGATPANSTVGKRITIAMVTHGQAFDPFWALVKKGAEQAASDFNVALRYSSPATTNPQAQATLITQAAAKKPAAMVVTIPDAPVLASPIRQITSSGMPVVVVNVGDRVWRGVGALTFVGQPDFTAGEEAGKAMAAASSTRRRTPRSPTAARGSPGSSPPAAARCRSCTSTGPSCIRRRTRSNRR